MMSWRWLVASVAVCVISAASDADAPADEAKKLEGTWTVTEATSDGKALESAKGGRWTFAGDKLTLEYEKEKVIKYTFKVYPTKKPKAMDLKFVEEMADVFPPTVIYQLDGDDLKLALGGPVRPKEFTDKEKQVLFKLKRKK